MKKMKRFLAVALSLVMVCAMLGACGSSGSTETTAAAETEEADAEAEGEEVSYDVLVFGTNAEFAPFEYVSANGVIDEYDGIDMAIAKRIGEDIGADVQINNMEFDSLLIALSNGQVDAVIAGMTVTEERQESVDFSTPYYQATQVMIVPEDSDITCAADMEGKTIAVIQGYTGEIAVQDLGYEYESFKKGADAILELTNGKADVVVIDSATASKYVSDNEGLKIVEDADVFEDEEYAIAVKKGNTELLDLINASIEEMLSDGTIAALGDEYAVSED